MIEDARSAHPEVSVRRLCELHGVSRSWFYEQQHREAVDPDQALVQDIEAVVEEFTGYGYRRVTCELARRGRPANHKRVLPNGSGEARPSTGHAGTPLAVPPAAPLPGDNGLDAPGSALPESAARGHPRTTGSSVAGGGRPTCECGEDLCTWPACWTALRGRWWGGQCPDSWTRS